MWIESNTPELAVPYLWTEEKQSSKQICVPCRVNDDSSVSVLMLCLTVFSSHWPGGASAVVDPGLPSRPSARNVTHFCSKGAGRVLHEHH